MRGGKLHPHLSGRRWACVGMTARDTVVSERVKRRKTDASVASVVHRVADISACLSCLERAEISALPLYSDAVYSSGSPSLHSSSRIYIIHFAPRARPTHGPPRDAAPFDLPPRAHGSSLVSPLARPLSRSVAPSTTRRAADGTPVRSIIDATSRARGGSHCIFTPFLGLC